MSFYNNPQIKIRGETLCLSPTIPFFPRHFYPIGYLQDLPMYPELGDPTPEAKDTPLRLSTYCFTWGSFCFWGWCLSPSFSGAMPNLRRNSPNPPPRKRPGLWPVW